MIEQWKELKETITEMRDNDGTGTQQDVCKFLVNYMGVLEKQMVEQEPLLDKIRAEIIEKYWDCDICKWEIDYKPHYNIRGDVNDILQIIDKYKGDKE